MDSGYIKLYRSMLNWEWMSESNTFHLFVYLLLKANFVDGKFKGEVIKRGELVTSHKQLRLELGLSEQQLRTAIKHLKATNEITSRSTSKYTIISIKNYNKYQQLTNELTSKQQTSNNQTTNKQPQYKKERKKEGKNIYTRGRARESEASYNIEELMVIK